MGKNASAVDLEKPISTLRERVTGMLVDWGADFATVLEELEEKRTLLQEIEVEADSQSHDVEALHERVKVQDTQIETLKIEAEEAATLRKEIHDKDRELEKKKSEIDSKHELIDSLRQEVKEVGQLKGAIKTKDKENARLVKEKKHAEQHTAKLTEELKISNASALIGIDATAELDAVRAELDVRKTVIESLRVDAERAQALEAQLNEKRDVISKLEASVDQHVSTRAGSQQSVTTWKEEPASLKSPDPSSEAVTDPVLRELNEKAPSSVDLLRTLAIDMTKPRLEGQLKARERKTTKR